MKVCIFGAGAIGGFLAVQLAKSGAELSLVARGAHLEAMRANGVRLLIDGEERVARLRCTDDPATLGSQDCVIVTLKAQQISAAAASIAPLLHRDSFIVTAYNGLPYWFFAGARVTLAGARLQGIDPDGRQVRLLGPERAIGCVVLPATEVVAPGVIRHDSGFTFPIGEPGGEHTARLSRLHEMFLAGGLKAPIRDDIRDEIWLKLWGNLCLNPISALTHATLDVLTSDPGARALARAMMLEAQAIGERLGLRLRVDVERRLDAAGAVGAHRMSMLQDLERGREMEIEPLVGVVQELGRLTGVPTPTLDNVLALIRLRAQVATNERVRGGPPLGAAIPAASARGVR
ncbi:MAG TPA: 2-dehydropantoate 2-reductase [Casimicrobiaceae bacterium]|nr:2-dehydropantoate 2-reductase [Casimicrobiaceae bacterium]